VAKKRKQGELGEKKKVTDVRIQKGGDTLGGPPCAKPRSKTRGGVKLRTAISVRGGEATDSQKEFGRNAIKKKTKKIKKKVSINGRDLKKNLQPPEETGAPTPSEEIQNRREERVAAGLCPWLWQGGAAGSATRKNNKPRH